MDRCAVIVFGAILLSLQNLAASVDHCLSNPCQNSGVCESRDDKGYICRCPSSHIGVNCESVNECGSNPCQNGGQCLDDLGKYTCSCKPGYTGLNCETDINECANGPCVNGATCLDGANRYSCLCKPGYTGRNCQLDIDECAQAPCRNQGVCVNQIEGFRCKCGPDYLGVRCEIYNEEYGRRAGLVWTIVAVAVIVILIMVVLAVSLPLRMRQQRLAAKRLESEISGDVIENGLRESRKKKSRIFIIPGIFRKNNKDTTKPIYFTVTRSSSFEMKITNSDVTLRDLRQMKTPPTSKNHVANGTVKRDDNTSFSESNTDPSMNWYLRRVTSADGSTMTNHVVDNHIGDQSHQRFVEGRISLVNNSYHTPGSGPHVTELYVNE